jgi:hypothetical protein
MKKTMFLAGALVVVLGVGALSAAAQEPSDNFSFFITSRNTGNGANFGGLDGADAHCQSLAAGVGAGGKTWRAYLSTSGTDGVDARDRIGDGPWYNVHGVQVASSVANLHSDDNNMTRETELNELGELVNGREQTPNQHDVLTGSNLDGTASENTCNNWSTDTADSSAIVGHFDRTGGGDNPTSWNSAHASRGCSLENLRSSGGEGYIFCLVAD